MATKLSLQKASEAWKTPDTCDLKPDPALMEAFAKILDEVWPDALMAQVDELQAKIDKLAGGS